MIKFPELFRTSEINSFESLILDKSKLVLPLELVFNTSSKAKQTPQTPQSSVAENVAS